MVIVGGQSESIKKISLWWKMEGSWNDNCSDESTVMVGAKVAAKLGYKVGDKVVLGIKKETEKSVGSCGRE